MAENIVADNQSYQPTGHGHEAGLKRRQEALLCVSVDCQAESVQDVEHRIEPKKKMKSGINEVQIVDDGGKVKPRSQ